MKTLKMCLSQERIDLFNAGIDVPKIEHAPCFDLNGLQVVVGDSITNGTKTLRVKSLIKFPLWPRQTLFPFSPLKSIDDNGSALQFAKVAIAADDEAVVIGRSPGLDDVTWTKVVEEAPQ